jgi:signal transduction histidine kinase
MRRDREIAAGLVERCGALGRMLLTGTDPIQRRWLTAVTAALVIGIGLLDYLVDNDDRISFRFFYSLAVLLAVTVRGWRFGVLIALASVGVMTAGDLGLRLDYRSAFTLGWNALISFSTYLLMIWLLSSLLTLQREIEERVRQGALALTREAAERERLERVITHTGEKERISIGHDLHDGLCQHLTGTAYAARLLADDLGRRQDALAPQALRIVSLIDEGVSQTRHLAKGLLLTAVEEDGLVVALEELAATASEQFRVKCEFICRGEPELGDRTAASNLYRIAQEAVRNAARHGRPDRITIVLETDPAALSLIVKDDGVGLHRGTESPSGGLGLRIMSYRADVIGASYSAESLPEGGTCITCRLPRAKATT